jgi:porphyrinogen peroxidase
VTSVLRFSPSSEEIVRGVFHSRQSRGACSGLGGRQALALRPPSTGSTRMSTGKESTPIPQPVLAPLTRSAIFLVVCIRPDRESHAAVRSLCADLPAIFRAVDFRRMEDGLSCVVAFGSNAWDRLFGGPRPAELHPFREIRSGARHAVSTPADVLFHIRARAMDMCFELAAQIMERIAGAVSAADEIHGFRYFDARDLLGFVDGTENPRDSAALEAALVGAEDPPFAGGSYVIVQKYLHDMTRWNALTTEEQELIVGRRKLSDIELDDAVKPSSAHSALTTIVENGKEVKILRVNMPFGKPGHGEFGTYFIGYSRSPRTTERMLDNMFIGRPPGNYDRILDFSHATTGSLLFAPSATFLENLGDETPAAAAASPPEAAPDRALRNTSLGIGSLKGIGSNE